MGQRALNAVFQILLTNKIYKSPEPEPVSQRDLFLELRQMSVKFLDFQALNYGLQGTKEFSSTI